MAKDETFEPKMGRARGQKTTAPKAFHSRVLKEAARSNGLKPGYLNVRSPSSGLKIGRGAGVARILTSMPAQSLRSRRVLLKVRCVKLAGKGIGALGAHLKYLQREGVSRDGSRGELYGRDIDLADGAAFLERSLDDRHQFRLILSPEDGHLYDDLRALTRRFMDQVETDLNTELDWVSSDHFNTGHPHAHILVRGRDDRGQDLLIFGDYLYKGMQARAESLVTLELGPRSDLEILEHEHALMSQSRLTQIDIDLLNAADDLGRVSAFHEDAETQTLRLRRLGKLQSYGLAFEEGPGHWRLQDDMEPTLQRMGERDNRVLTLFDVLRANDLEHALVDSVIHEPDRPGSLSARPITGRVLSCGFVYGQDFDYTIIEATDGRVHYVEVGLDLDRDQGLGKQDPGPDSLVRVTPRFAETTLEDQVIADIAAQNSGRYSVGLHRLADPDLSQDIIDRHVERLEIIQEATGKVWSLGDGTYTISQDYLATAFEFELADVHRRPAIIEKASEASLEAQISKLGVTWLDQSWAEGDQEQFADAGFGKLASQALKLRQEWLLEAGIVSPECAGEPLAPPGLIDALHGLEREHCVADLERQTGRSYLVLNEGDRIEGRISKSVSLGDETFAMIERAHQFMLVPWSSEMDSEKGHKITGSMTERGFRLHREIERDLGLDL